MTDLPALSIRQPWAELILRGSKTIEIRRWATEYRGPAWLHTGRIVDQPAMTRFGFGQLFTGGFVGQVSIKAVLLIDEARWVQWAERHLAGHYTPGLFGWALGDVKRLHREVPAAGQLGLFVPPSPMQEQLRAALL